MLRRQAVTMPGNFLSWLPLRKVPCKMDKEVDAVAELTRYINDCDNGDSKFDYSAYDEASASALTELNCDRCHADYRFPLGRLLGDWLMMSVEERKDGT